MDLGIDEKDIEKLVILGSNVFIKPLLTQKTNKTGPLGIVEQENLQSGRIIKIGPDVQNSDIKLGDLVVYLQDSSWGYEHNEEKYVIVPKSAILLLVKEDDN